MGGSGKKDVSSCTVSFAFLGPSDGFDDDCSDALVFLALLSRLFLIWRVVFEPDCASILFISSGSRFTHLGCDLYFFFGVRRVEATDNEHLLVLEFSAETPLKLYKNNHPLSLDNQ